MNEERTAPQVGPTTWSALPPAPPTQDDDDSSSAWSPEDAPVGARREIDDATIIVEPVQQPARGSESSALPPAAPPSSSPATMSRTQRRSGWIVPWLVAGLVTTLVAAASFWFGRASAPDADAAALTPVTTSLTAPTTTEPGRALDAEPVPGAAGDDTPEAQDAPPVGTPQLDPSNPEPVAAVAAAVGPAVVQLELGGGVGSGVIYDPEGFILTAAHVVDRADTLTVRLADGLRVPGEVVGLHAPTDVAVVKIEPVAEMPVARLGIDVDPQVGQRAVALGSPFGLDQSVTAGIVSAVNREVNGVGMIQTDAAINPGNSGGPLVDISGNVIGINDAIRTLSGANDGVGFAIPIDLAVIVADQLVAGEDVQLARLGVTSQPFNDGRVGALVIEVVEGSAAADAGIEVGDLITSVDGAPISDPRDLRGEILSEAPGTDVVLEIVRDGQLRTLTATLGAASIG